jgi:hypothetical protein
LKTVVGDTQAVHLLGALDAAADDMHDRQRVEENSETGRHQARHHATVAKRIVTLTGRLLRELDQVSTMRAPPVKPPRRRGPFSGDVLVVSRGRIRAAGVRGDRPGGDDHAAASRFRAIMVSGDSRATLATLSHAAREWEKEARAASKGTRGRTSVGERVRLVTWVGALLANSGIPLIKSPDGVFAHVVEIVCQAAGMRTPTDFYRDVAAALDDPRAYWHGGPTLTALPRPPRKPNPLHKSKRRRRIV